MGLDWNALDASGTATNRVTLLKNAAGITLSNHTPGKVKSKINSAGTTEYNIDVLKDNLNKITDITYEGYQFKGVTQATTVMDGTNKDAFGGRSKAGNTTTGNTITVSDAATYRNIYGGWTNGAGSEAAADKQKDSTLNKVTVNGSASVMGTVYGGFSDVADGKATSNEVTIEKNLAANVVGGEAKGEASGNIVTVSANANTVTGGKSTGDASGNIVNLANATIANVTGGEGATTNNNTINLNGNAQIAGTLTGGSQANGTGNTLNVKGKDNKAGTISNVQNMNFDATGLAKGDTMLEATDAGETTVDWTNLKASGMATKPLTLLKNTHGINLAGYTGAAKSPKSPTRATSSRA